LLSDNDDPLQLLRAWVEPTVWQRLRLRFARHRVLALEQNTHTFEDPHSRLDTLWQAVVWRITTTTNEEYLL
jgi:ABC-type dipeptide/oligopeptide/nickel transport system ATPase subunit